MKKRNKLENFIVAAIISTRVPLMPVHYKQVVDSLVLDLRLFNGSNIQIHHRDGRTWRIQLKVWSAIMDLEVSPLCSLLSRDHKSF